MESFLASLHHSDFAGMNIVVSLFLYGLTIVFVLLFLFLWGKIGLYLYNALAIVTCNIQVLKAAKFPFSDAPIALGSTVFMSLFLTTALLSVFYGPKEARAGVIMGFVFYLAFTLFMLVTLTYQPLPEDSHLFASSHAHMAAIFTPSPAILAASLIAYVISQFVEILILRRVQKSYFWLQMIIALVVGFVIDNSVFSFLAWGVFLKTGYTIQTIFKTYILGVGFERLFCSLGYVPIFYLARHLFHHYNLRAK